MRDKLIELIRDFLPIYLQHHVEGMADYLIANGVTFAEDNNVGDKPMTNGDRIRSMSDEELMKAFGHYTICGYIQEKQSGWCETNGACSNCLLRWLKQQWEVEE
jgi:hypothetical protein